MTKRFISGAKCPACQLEDELVVYAQAGRDVMECLACGYTEKRPTVDELKSEKATQRAQLDESAADIVQVVTLKKPKT